MLKAKNLEYEEFKKILPVHYRYLHWMLSEITEKLHAKMCNRGLYHYSTKPRVESVGIMVDLNPRKPTRLRIWARVGGKSYQTSSDVCPPPIPSWFKKGTKKSNKKLKNNPVKK